MNNFVLFAQPWWVNILIFVPIAIYFLFRKGLTLTKFQLIVASIFGIAFGFLEATVVVYLRAATGLLSQPANLYQPNVLLDSLTKNLLTIEFFREIATMVMIVTIALLVVKRLNERCAIFLWVFAFWDIFYYLGLWVTTGWPSSLTSQDVLFLIPVAWVSQVWFPFLISGATILVIAIRSRARKKHR